MPQLPSKQLEEDRRQPWLSSVVRWGKSCTCGERKEGKGTTN